MDRRQHHQLYSPIVSPLGYALVFPVVDMNGGGRVIGHVTQLLLNLEQVADAILLPGGYIHQTLSPIIQHADASAGTIGNIKQLLKLISEAGVGTTNAPIQGTIADTLKLIRQAASGYQNNGVINERLKLIQQHLTAASEVFGVGAQELGLLFQHVSAAMPVEAQVAQLLQLIRQTAHGSESPIGEIHQLLAPLGFQVQAHTVNVWGDVEQTLFELTQHLNAKLGAGGKIKQVLTTPIVLSLTAYTPPTAYAHQRLFPITEQAFAIEHPIGRIKQVLSPVILNGVAARTSAIVQELFAPRQSLIAGMEAFGPAKQRLFKVTNSDIDGVVSALGATHQALKRFSQQAQGIHTNQYGSIKQLLRRTLTEVDGFVTTAAVIKQVLPKLSEGGSASVSNSAYVAQTLYRVRQQVMVLNDVHGPITTKLPRLVQSAHAIETDVGYAAQTLNRIAQEIEGHVVNSEGTIHTLLGRFYQEVDGFEHPKGTTAQTLQHIKQHIDAIGGAQGSTKEVLRRFFMDADALESFPFVGQTLLKPVYIKGAGSALNYMHGEQVLFPPFQDVEAWAGVVGHMGQQLFRVFMSGISFQPTFGTITQRLQTAKQRVDAQFHPHIPGVITQTLPEPVQTVRGIHGMLGPVNQVLRLFQQYAPGMVYPPVVGLDEEAWTPGGRLTLVSGTPWMNTAVTNATTLYYTNAINSTIYYWSGTAWIQETIGELAAPLSDSTYSPRGATYHAAYDVFVWKDNTGTYRLSRGPQWPDITGRSKGNNSSELMMRGGFFTNKYAISHGPAAGYGLYVGTIWTDGSTKMSYTPNIAGTVEQSSIRNMYNNNRPQAELKVTYDNNRWPNENDPYFANVVNLIRVNDAGTAIVDIISGATVSTQINDADIYIDNWNGQQKWYGRKTVAFPCPGTGNCINMPGSFNSAWANVDWTIEGWFYTTGVSTKSTYGQVLDFSTTASQNTGFQFQVGAGIVYNASRYVNTWWNSANHAVASVWNDKQWHHVAIVINSTAKTLTVYLDGSQISSAGWTYAALNGSQSAAIGTPNTNLGSWAGWFDSLRVTKGVQRYTGGFSTSGQPFPEY